MIRRSLLAVAVAWALASTACGRHADDAPPCTAVAARFLDLATHDLAEDRADEATERAVTEQLPVMRDSLVETCVDRAWSPAVRACLAQAASHERFEACEQQLTDEQRRDLDRVNGSTSGPTP